MCPYPVVSKKLDQGTMQWDLYAKIVNELAAEPLFSGIIYELHNEPLLDKRLLDLVKYFKSVSKDKWCMLITNGELLDKYSLKDIKESNIDSIVVSLNANSKATYQMVNKGLDYDRVINNISSLMSDSYIKERLSLSFVVSDENMPEIHQATKYWNKNGVGTRIIGITNRAGTLEGYEKFKMRTEYKGNSLLFRLWRRFISRLEIVTGCHHPFAYMNILFNGDVVICCHDWNRATIIGNARDNSLREIWNSPKANEIRRLIIKKKYEQIETCSGCSLASNK